MDLRGILAPINWGLQVEEETNRNESFGKVNRLEFMVLAELNGDCVYHLGMAELCFITVK